MPIARHMAGAVYGGEQTIRARNALPRYSKGCAVIGGRANDWQAKRCVDTAVKI